MFSQCESWNCNALRRSGYAAVKVARELPIIIRGHYVTGDVFEKIGVGEILNAVQVEFVLGLNNGNLTKQDKQLAPVAA